MQWSGVRTGDKCNKRQQVFLTELDGNVWKLEMFRGNIAAHGPHQLIVFRQKEEIRKKVRLSKGLFVLLCTVKFVDSWSTDRFHGQY